MLTWIFIILSVLLAIGTFLYLKKVEGGGDNPINPIAPQKQQLPSQRKNSLENLWPILDITEGIMELPNELLRGYLPDCCYRFLPAGR